MNHLCVNTIILEVH